MVIFHSYVSLPEGIFRSPLEVERKEIGEMNWRDMG